MSFRLWRFGFGLCAVALGVGAAAAPASSDDLFRFSSGMRPLEVRAGELGLSSVECTVCHAREGAAWEQSRHRYAWSNAIFMDSYASEPRARCVGCHAPLEQQRREIAAGRASQGALAHEGITCAVCHVRDGVVLTPRDSEGSMHRTRTALALRDPRFCAACHELAFTDGHEMMQTTYSEWQQYVAHGGDKTCQQCHMPDGAHTFPGAHDEEFLRGALRVSREPDALVLEAVNVGHAVPTGDLFRHITVEVDGEVVAVLGKRWDRRRNLLDDTRLQPFERRRIDLRGGRRVRVVYHYAPDDRDLPVHQKRLVLFEALTAKDQHPP